MSTPDRERVFVLALVSLTILVLGIGTVVGVLFPGAAVGGSESDTESHLDPDRVRDGTDLNALERQMADRLAERARSGSINISRENVARARERLNDSQYESLLNQYASVAEETGQTEKALAFRAVRSDQVTLTTAIERYWTVYDWYQGRRNGTLTGQDRIETDVKADALPTPRTVSTVSELLGNERLLARTLERQWQTVKRQHTALITSQKTLANVSAQNPTRSLAAINSSVAAVNTTQQTVRAEQFTPTRLSVGANATNISYRSPAALTGQLQTADGTPVANESIRLRVGNQTLRTRTDQRGRFERSYRPTTVAANTTTLLIQYRPNPEGKYFASGQRVGVDIQPTRPTVTATATPGETAYNQSLRVTGRVGDTAGIANVSYVVLVAGQALAQNTTDSTGAYASNISVPASVQDGTRAVEVVVPLDGYSLLRTNATASVSVSETATVLSGTATHVEDRRIRVTGRLATAGDDPVPNQQLTVTANGTVLGTVTTQARGEFERTFVVPESVGSAGPFDSLLTVAVDVRYADAESNLRDSVVGDTVLFSTIPIGIWSIGGITAVLGLVAVGRVAKRRFQRRQLQHAMETRDTEAAVPQPTPEPATEPTTLFDSASAQLSEGRLETAVSLGYLGLRQQLSEDVSRHTGLTPWEFYNACRDNPDLDAEQIRTLRQATELYEEVRFSSVSAPISTETVSDLFAAIDSMTTERADRSSG